MERLKWGIAIFWLLAFGLLIWASFKLMVTLVEIAPAIIAAFATIFAALLSYFLNQQKEIRLLQQIEKQKNYERLIIVLSEFIRNPHEKDNLDSVQLYSWIVGSGKVVEKAQRFAREIDDTSLKNLLDEMRRDIGLNPTNKKVKIEVFLEKEIGYLKTRKAANESDIYNSNKNYRKTQQAEGLLSKLFRN